MSKSKRKNKPEKARKNLVVGMNTKNWINDHIKKSNPAYRNGYIPYFVRRRMEFTDENGNEVVDDTTIKVEYTRLHSYKNNTTCSREHFHSLIEYMKSKNTLFMPGIIPEGEENKIVKEGNEYRLANMAFRCLSFYMHGFLNNITLEEASQFEDKLLSYINKEDLIAWITTCFKVGHETSLAKTHATILLMIDNGKITTLLHKEIIERMVTYILVDSKPEEFGESCYLADNIMRNHSERVIEVASGFRKEEAGLIDLTRIDTSLLTKYAYQIICNGHQVFGNSNTTRFIHLETAYEFISQFMKEDIPKELKEKHTFDIALIEQDGLSTLFDRDGERIPAVEYTDACNNLDELNECIRVLNDSQERLEHFDIMQYLYFLPVKGYGLFIVHPYILEDERVFRVFAYCMYRDIVTRSYGFGTLSNLLTDDKEIEKLIATLDKFFPDQYGTIRNDKHDFVIPFLLILSGEMDNTKDSIEHRLSTRFANAMLVKDKLVRFVIEHTPPGVINFDTKHLKTALAKGASYNSIMRVASLDTNFDLLKETYNSAWVEMPASPLANLPKDYTIDAKRFGFLRDVLTIEQWKSYPFNTKIMNDYREWFEQFIGTVNIDRYIAAYGIDWAEEHSSISLTDIVESGSYVNRDVIERYLDIILLDDELRSKFLHNKEAVSKLLEGNTISEIVHSDVFPNTTKCELIYAALSTFTPSDVEKAHTKGNNSKAKNYTPFRIEANNLAMECLVGSGFVGRTLAYELKLFTNDEIRNSNIFDAAEEEK